MPRLRDILLFTGLLLPALARAQPGTATNRQVSKPPSAGLFVGVNEFTEDDTIQDLNYAVNDAIDLAHLFVIDLRMVPPKNARLLLSGTPDEDDTRRRKKLQNLEAEGVVPLEATKTKILKSLRDVVSATQTRSLTPDTVRSDFLVVSISSHGFQENNGTNYVIPRDGLLWDLVGTGIDLKASIESKIEDAQAGKKLILIDACRNEVEAEGDRSTAEAGATGRAVTQAFVEAFEETRGQMVFYSGSPTQVSYEDHTLQQGVFTHYLLRAIGPNSPVAADEQGLIRLGDVVTYVKREVEQWSIDNRKPTVQQPLSAGGGGADAIPFAQVLPKGRLYVIGERAGTEVYIEGTRVAVLEGEPHAEEVFFTTTLPEGEYVFGLHLPPTVYPAEEVLANGGTPSVLDTLWFNDHEGMYRIEPNKPVLLVNKITQDFAFFLLEAQTPEGHEVKAQVSISDSQGMMAGAAMGVFPCPEPRPVASDGLETFSAPEILLGTTPLFRPLPRGLYAIRVDAGPGFDPHCETRAIEGLGRDDIAEEMHVILKPTQ